MDLPVTVSLLSVRLIANNIGQAVEGGKVLTVAPRLWPMIIPLVGGTPAGANLLVSVDRGLLNGVVGASLTLLAALMFGLPRFRLDAAADK